MNNLRDVDKMTESERRVEMEIDAKRRTDNCLVDIRNVLSKWNCKIDPMFQLSSQGVATSYAIVPLITVKM